MPLRSARSSATAAVAALVQGTVEIIASRGDGIGLISMAEYWLQVELWRRAAQGHLGGLRPATLGELPYKTSEPARSLQRGGTGFHWCDAVFVAGSVALWVEMKDLGLAKERARANAAGFVRKNILPLASMCVEETLAELAIAPDRAAAARKDANRHEAIQAAAKLLEGVVDHVGVALCLALTDGNESPPDVAARLYDAVLAARRVTVDRRETAWPGRELIVSAFALPKVTVAT